MDVSDIKLRLASYAAGFWWTRNTFVPCWQTGRHTVVLCAQPNLLVSQQPLLGDDVKVRFDFDEEVEVSFGPSPRWRINISFRNIQKIRVESTPCTLFITMRCPPKLSLAGLVRHTDYPKRGLAATTARPEEGLLGTCLECCLSFGDHDPDPTRERVLAKLRSQHFSKGGNNTAKVSQMSYQKLPLARLSPDSLEGIHEDLVYALACLVSAGFVRIEKIDADPQHPPRDSVTNQDRLRAEAALSLMWRKRCRHSTSRKHSNAS